jgi:hypothetical protein
MVSPAMPPARAGRLLPCLLLLACEGPAAVPPPPPPPQPPAPRPPPATIAAPPQALPRLDAAAKARLRAVYLAGQRGGVRPGVFAKVGDSITAAGEFLYLIGCEGETLAAHAGLGETIRFFRRTPLEVERTPCGPANSFDRHSRAAASGWTAERAIARLSRPDPACPPPHDTPLRCELSLLRPSVALIMFGTNEVAVGADLASYRAALEQIVHDTLMANAVPVLSTIPPRTDHAYLAERVPAYNEVVAAVARERGVPLWDYHLAMHDASLIEGGLADGIHPNAFEGNRSVDFSAEALRYGANLRNLQAVQVLDALRRVVIQDGDPGVEAQ